MVVMITSEEYKELVIKANKYDEMQKTKLSSEEQPKHMAEECEVEVKKITVDLQIKTYIYSQTKKTAN